MLYKNKQYKNEESLQTFIGTLSQISLIHKNFMPKYYKKYHGNFSELCSAALL